jgi:hypothetical protein
MFSLSTAEHELPLFRMSVLLQVHSLFFSKAISQENALRFFLFQITKYSLFLDVIQ